MSAVIGNFRLVGKEIKACCNIAILLTVSVIAAYSASAQDVPTWHYDNVRSGVQANETVLTPANVNSTNFGKVFSLPVVGDVYAQPLYLKQYKMSDGLLHNVLIVATTENYVYALDADGKNPAQGYLWRVSLLGSGETFVSSNDVGTGDITPNVGITGTPAIDRTGGTIYVVAKSKTTTGTVTFIQRLHALNIADGTEKLNGPANIAATVVGSGDGATTVAFSPLLNNQRSALLLAPTPSVGSGNSIIISWSSHGDNGRYHGWVIAYDASNISKQNGAWTDTPNGSQGGIWMSGGGPSTDGLGNIFAAGGNGSFDANTGGGDYGDSAFRLTLSTAALSLQDYFTPGDQSSLNAADNDMGTSALTLLPAQSGALPHLAVTADKSGTIYLLNRDQMGDYTTPGDTSLESFSDGGYSVHSSFVFFNNTLFEGGDGGPVQAWTFNPSTELFTTAPQSKSNQTYGCGGCDGAGSTPSVSANGTSNGIVWTLDNSAYGSGSAVLHAYNPANLATEYYNSTQAGNSRDAAAFAVKFTTPTIANGQVYVGGQNAVTVYGLLSTNQPLTATPAFSPAGGTYIGTQTVAITDSTANASIYYTTDGSTPSTGSALYTGALQVASSETVQAVAIAPGFSQSADGLAAYTISPVTAPGGQTEVSLSSAFNAVGIYSDGTAFSTGGLDGGSAAYSAKQLGASLSYSGVSYVFGAANQNNVIKGVNAPVVALPAGTYSTLKFLATGVNGNQVSQVFTVAYTDGSTTSFTQSLSDWFTPQSYAGEAIGLATAYRDTSSGGQDARTFNVYQYSFALNAAKTVKSITLPNNGNVAVLAITLVAGQTRQVSLASVANTTGIYTDGTTFTTGGLDRDGYAYSAKLLGSSLTYGGVGYAFGLPNQNDAVHGSATSVISLPAGSYASLKLLAEAVNGNQTAQVFMVTYTDGTVAKFTQSLSDWFRPQKYPGEATALASSYRDTSSGGQATGPFNIYQYSFVLNAGKTVKSLTLPNNPNLLVMAVTLSVQ